MNISEEINIITPKILPLNCHFSDQQKAVISAENSIDVVAGPGSGKTTVLTAKYGLLIKKLANSNKGICLITHTNVAVDEIRIGLNKIEIYDIEYPNFIGTIQEFFNYFFAKKAFHLILKEKVFRVLDDEEYQEKFNDLFNERKPHWYNYNNPNVKKQKPKIRISDDLTYSFESNVTSGYSEAFNGSIETLFSWGIVTNHQCLEMSMWYIDRYGEKLQKAMSNRFKYILLDEAQDTNSLQFQMLNYLFSNGNVSFQKFGDPYQALYNIFDCNIDSWIPTKRVDANYLEISETSRFGSSIANIVKNVCVEKYDVFTSLNIVSSFNPYYIIYKNEEDLITKYKRLVDHFNLNSESFLKSNRKDAILAPFHDDLSNLFSGYAKPVSKKSNNLSQIKQILHFLFNLFAREIELSFLEVRKKIEQSHFCKIKLSKCILEITSGKSDMTYAVTLLNEVLDNLTNNEVHEFSKTNLIDQLDTFNPISFSNSEYESDVSSDFYIGTVHSAKGETHRSTLLVLNAHFTEYFGGGEEYSMFELLSDYLVGNYNSLENIESVFKKNQTTKSLKLAYVALSRPTHLMSIAIPESLIRDSNIITEFNEFGWADANNLPT